MRYSWAQKAIVILLMVICGMAVVGMWPGKSSQSSTDSVAAISYVANPANSPSGIDSPKIEVTASIAGPMLVANSASATANQTAASVTTGSTVCPSDPLDHVYKPQRLQLVDPCKTVTGTIDSVWPIFDGDVHIGLKLDPQFSNLTNDCNKTCLFGVAEGNLVVEVVCAFLPIYPKEARATCHDYHNSVEIPLSGRVSVTGAYVKDLDHGWMEIHPVWEVKSIL